MGIPKETQDELVREAAERVGRRQLAQAAGTTSDFARRLAILQSTIEIIERAVFAMKVATQDLAREVSGESLGATPNDRPSEAAVQRVRDAVTPRVFGKKQEQGQ